MSCLEDNIITFNLLTFFFNLVFYLMKWGWGMQNFPRWPCCEVIQKNHFGLHFVWNAPYNKIEFDFHWPLIESLLIGMRRRGSDLLCRNPVSFPQPVEEGNLSVTSGCWPRPPGPLLIPPRCHNLWSGWREWRGQLTLQQQQQQQRRRLCGQVWRPLPPRSEAASFSRYSWSSWRGSRTVSQSLPHAHFSRMKSWCQVSFKLIDTLHMLAERQVIPSWQSCFECSECTDHEGVKGICISTSELMCAEPTLHFDTTQP